MRTRIVYTDTSVFGGVFNWEFERFSRMFFEQVRQGLFSLRVSSLVTAEMTRAPDDVRSWFDSLEDYVKRIPLSAEVIELAQAYVRAGIVGSRSFADALHVSAASVANCDAIVSWNFRHIVHAEKTPLYNAVNRIRGYNEIAICSPQEVIRYE